MTETVQPSSKQKASRPFLFALACSIVLVICIYFGFSAISSIFSPAPTVSTSWQNAQSVTLHQATFVKNKDSRYDSDKYIVTGQDSHSETITYYTSTKPTIDKGKLNGKIISTNMIFTFGDDDYGKNMLYFAQSDSNYIKQLRSINDEISSANIFLQGMHILGFIVVVALSLLFLFTLWVSLGL